MNEPTLNRRHFLKGGLVTLTLAAAGGIVQKRLPASQAAGSSRHQWVMIIDQNKCTGCGYCTLACQAHNDSAPAIEWNRVINNGKLGDRDVFLPRPCMHCDHAPCVSVCPVKASTQRADGIVMMDYERCIGCRYCEVACPYGARAFNWEAFTGENPAVPEWGIPEVERRPRGVVEKCSFCYHRIERGLSLGLKPGEDTNATPACVVVCPVNARLFGDLNDPDSKVSHILNQRPSFRLREDMGTGPHVYYLPAHQDES